MFFWRLKSFIRHINDLSFVHKQRYSTELRSNNFLRDAHSLLHTSYNTSAKNSKADSDSWIVLEGEARSAHTVHCLPFRILYQNTHLDSIFDWWDLRRQVEPLRDSLERHSYQVLPRLHADNLHAYMQPQSLQGTKKPYRNYKNQFQ